MFPLTVSPNTIFDRALIYEREYGTLPVAEDREQNSILCSCINFLKSIGITVSGDAYDLQPNAAIEVGAIALFHYPNRLGHAALVTEVHEGYFYVTEANFKRCRQGVRKVDNNDKSLIGFLKI